MIDVFKKHEKPYQRIVRRFAIDIWKNRATKETYHDFFMRAFSFRNRYERDLIQYYREKNIKIFPGTIRAKADQWYKDQQNLVETVQAITHIKKENIKAELFDEYVKTKSPKVQKLLNDLYLNKSEKEAGVSVLRVYSFSDNLLKKAEQLGSQSAYDLGSDINESVLSENYEAYDWNTQEDSRVRRTHRKLNKKTFLYSDPPTTIDKYGREHTGHTGTDWGCRCFATPPTGKPKLNYVVRE